MINGRYKIDQFKFCKGNSYTVVRHKSGYFYIQRQKNSSGFTTSQEKLKNDLKIMRSQIYRKLVKGNGRRFFHTVFQAKIVR